MKVLNELKGIKKSSLGMWVAIIIGLHLGFGKTEQSNKELNASIEKTLLQNCNCESVVSQVKGTGISYDKDYGLSLSKLEFTLRFCDFDNSMEEEANRLNKILKRNVEEYKTKGLVVFNFESVNKMQSIVMDIKTSNTFSQN